MTDSKGSDTPALQSKAAATAEAQAAEAPAKKTRQTAGKSQSRSTGNKSKTAGAKNAKDSASPPKSARAGADPAQTADAKASGRRAGNTAGTAKKSAEKESSAPAKSKTPAASKTTSGRSPRGTSTAKAAASAKTAKGRSPKTDLPLTENAPSGDAASNSPATPLPPAETAASRSVAVTVNALSEPAAPETAGSAADHAGNNDARISPAAPKEQKRGGAGTRARGSRSVSAKNETAAKKKDATAAEEAGTLPESVAHSGRTADSRTAQEADAPAQQQPKGRRSGAATAKGRSSSRKAAASGTEKTIAARGGASGRDPGTDTAMLNIPEGSAPQANAAGTDIPEADSSAIAAGPGAMPDGERTSGPGHAGQLPVGEMEAQRPEIPVSNKELERIIQLSPAALLAAFLERMAQVKAPETDAPGTAVDLSTPGAATPDAAMDLSMPGAATPPPAPGVQAQAETPEFSDFPTSFDDLSAEDAFESADADEEAKDADAPGRKRRSRGRRGRGRKKAAASGAEQAAQQPDQAEVEAEIADAEAEEPEEQRPAAAKSAGTDAAAAKSADTDTAESAAEAKAARRKMFVSVLPEEQVEVVITEEGLVLEYYVEMLHQAKTKGNIYKGVIHNVDPNLQAAFVSYGGVKNGFLQIDEVHPEYYNVAHEAEKGRKYPPIQKVLKPGQEVLVQVVKEPAGTKGAFLTTYLSLPGRYLVLTPGREQIGVSRKVENEKERARLRELLEGLNPGPGLGVIVRTVSMGASKTNLQRDLQFLKRTWKDVRTRGTSDKAPCLIYQEQDLTARAIRDYLTESIGEVWVDDEKTADEVVEIATALFPRKHNLVRMHKEDTGTSLFERFNLQRQLDQIHSREVSLPSGGRLVIDPTEALTAIDINSGRSGGKSNFEDMAYRTNMEAARMIPLQLRLRDIGGQVVADFIEMRDKSHWREVEKTLRNGMKVDRARYDVGKIGPFGLLEIVRQRLGSSAISISTEPCPCCSGSGLRRNMEWQSQHALREILRALRVAQSQKQESISYAVDPELAMHLLNHKRRRLLEMENSFGISVGIELKK